MSGTFVIGCNYCGGKIELSIIFKSEKEEETFCSKYCEEQYKSDKYEKERILALLKDHEELSFIDIFKKLLINQNLLVGYLKSLERKKDIILTGYYMYKLADKGKDK